MVTKNKEKEFIVGKTKVGGKNPCFIVAEIGINFNKEYKNALSLIDSAKNAGCDAVKFQLFKAERMYPPNAGEDKTGGGRKKDIYKIVKEGALPPEWIPRLKDYANKGGLEFFSTVYDEDGVNVLEKYEVDAYKIASYEITHIPLLREVAKKNKPVILSTGAATITEISEALKVFEEEGNKKIGLLHCVAEYGVGLDNVNLNVLNTFKLAFPNSVVGYSDHSVDPVIAPRAAVALGAKIIEKHITLDKKLEGPDHFFALDPTELSLMVKAVRETERKLKEGKKIAIDKRLLGTSEKRIYSLSEEGTRRFTHRCVFSQRMIQKGEIFTPQNIIVLRPGNIRPGLEPKYYELLIKKYRATKDIPKHSPVSWDDVLLR